MWKRQEGSPRSLWREPSPATPAFQTPDLQAVRGSISLMPGPPVCGTWFWQPRKLVPMLFKVLPQASLCNLVAQVGPVPAL